MSTAPGRAAPHPSHPHDPHRFGLVKIRNLASGLVIERPGVDAHEMVDSGGYELAPADAVTAWDRLQGMSKNELVQILRTSPGLDGCSAGMPANRLAAALLPHIERGALSFPEGG